jgi:long-subunit acyl-CoA synthetase (AMP-forming)
MTIAHGQTESSPAIDKDGWLRTGDLAEMQPNGYFRIRGRAKDTVIRGDGRHGLSASGAGAE